VGLDTALQRRYRVVHAPQLLAHFASDRSHMLLQSDGHPAGVDAGEQPQGPGRRSAVYAAPPPRHPGIVAPVTGHSNTLPLFLDMSTPERASLTELSQREYGGVLVEADFLASCAQL